METVKNHEVTTLCKISHFSTSDNVECSKSQGARVAMTRGNKGKFDLHARRDWKVEPRCRQSAMNSRDRRELPLISWLGALQAACCVNIESTIQYWWRRWCIQRTCSSPSERSKVGNIRSGFRTKQGSFGSNVKNQNYELHQLIPNCRSTLNLG